ncbi:MAG TPA: hypothetical protein DCY51_01975 [Bacteroidetes bacterium]|nr:hypothetical protein [Bacteroidota bacterium]
MFVKKNFGFKEVMRFSGGHLIWLTLWTIVVPSFIETLHYYKIEAFKVPWLPVSLVGTAVAFYVGFKNNSSYDRLWKARKIWGAIVNSSRMWGSNVKGYVSNQFSEKDISEVELRELHKKIYRHIGWLYSLRSQLLISTPWEHIRQGGMMQRQTEKTMKGFGVGLFEDYVTKEELPQFLPDDEIDRLINAQNTATQIVDQQAQDLKVLRSRNLIDDFRHMELQKVLNDFYTHQGMAEPRLKSEH